MLTVDVKSSSEVLMVKIIWSPLPNIIYLVLIGRLQVICKKRFFNLIFQSTLLILLKFESNNGAVPRSVSYFLVHIQQYAYLFRSDWRRKNYKSVIGRQNATLMYMLVDSRGGCMSTTDNISGIYNDLLYISTCLEIFLKQLLHFTYLAYLST